MDAFHTCLALGPVAVYLLLLGAINLSRRPLLVSGTRDAAALGLAVAGLAAVGPMELFFPYAAAARYGTYVWVFLMAFYALCLVLVLLSLRPRLVIYNVSSDELRPILADLVPRLDPDARWAGDALILPNMGVQLHLENASVMRNISLVATGPRQNYLGWRRLETALRGALAQGDMPHDARTGRIIGGALIGAGVLIVVLLIAGVARNASAVASALWDMLRIQR